MRDAEVPIPDPSPDAITVLVVDDERSNVESLEKIFLREGMRVFTAFDAKRALELVRSHRIDVVLTDLRMPGADGMTVVRTVRTEQTDVEVIVLTAHGFIL